MLASLGVNCERLEQGNPTGWSGVSNGGNETSMAHHLCDRDTVNTYTSLVTPSRRHMVETGPSGTYGEKSQSNVQT